MITRRHFVAGAGALAAAAMTGNRSAIAQGVPAGYPAGYGDLVDKAVKEGAVSIYTSTDDVQGRPLIEAFRAAFPGIRVDYNDLGTNGAYNRVISEAAAKQVGSDIVWTSAMDLQMVLVSKGQAETYTSPEAAQLPAWANFNDQLYATSVEPVAIMYNKSMLGALKPPQTRAELIAFLQTNKDVLKGKVASFDPEKSGSGFLFFNNDARTTTDTWELVKAFGGTDPKVYGSSGAMREKIASGEHWIAFNLIGSYAIEWAKKNSNLGVVLPPDHAAAFSRVANISKGAPHPAAARVFLDFLLSQRGQTAMAGSGAPSIRTDVSEGLNIAKLNEMAGGKLKPIPVSAALLEASDPKTRAEFFQKWKQALRG
ncbi:ABC transporter substrate-binding protein [Bosea vaviloviae]|uniref:ABC transporter substrate-binding protein n=1 Tax=Bosea vaviloviae TaxID=1526658 RepID=A0A1D7TVF1_9HYPH|nr:ABC transporter substrate-binding protein [Bosea vaviloviae]AOO79093.1 ABC transporter substrate-binding protein [Bosea vaviloviae]